LCGVGVDGEDDKLLLLSYYFAQTGVLIEGRLYNFYWQAKMIGTFLLSIGGSVEGKGCAVWYDPISNSLMGIDKFWWLNK